jgi:iron complex transport system substrate-binding protein
MQLPNRLGRQRKASGTSCGFRFIVLLCLAGAGAVSLSPGANADIELQQADGSVLVLRRPAKTLITLAPHLTELAFDAGAGRQVIATVEFSEYPREAASIPRVGDAFRLDLERILELKPNLVVAWHSGNPPAAIAHLQSLGIPTWTIEIRRPEDIATALEGFGVASGNPAAAQVAAAHTRNRLESLRALYAGLPAVTYFYQVAAHPLYTVTGEHLISRSLALCNARNVFQDTPGLAPQVSHEAVIAANPQALLAPAGPEAPDPLSIWRKWGGMQAVSSDALFLLPADEISRATPRMLDAVAEGCERLNELRSPGPAE